MSLTNTPNHSSQPAWRAKLADRLESKQAHAIAIVLLLTDLTLTTLELKSSLLSCKASNTGENRQEGHETTPWYHWLGVVILGLLWAKTAVLAAALGWPELRRRPGLAVDAVALSVAIAMEMFLEKRGGGLVVIVSLWRVVRVVESAFEITDDAIAARIEDVESLAEGLREENRRLEKVVGEKDEMIEKLREDLDLCKEDCPGLFETRV